MARGEIAVAAIFIALGAFWVFQALKLPLRDGFAPSSGFLPLVFGLLLIGITVAAVLVGLRAGTTETTAVAAPMRRSLVVLALIVAGVAATPLIGFAAAMALMCFVLYFAVEGHAVAPSALASIATAAALTLVFRLWLGVPLPAGPWGF